ncbi:MAG: LysM peptidoglycan-binding domain-containing protein [Thermodesulfobacteriota bacterium]
MTRPPFLDPCPRLILFLLALLLVSGCGPTAQQGLQRGIEPADLASQDITDPADATDPSTACVNQDGEPFLWPAEDWAAAEEEPYTPVEPEATVGPELAALEALGSWDVGEAPLPGPTASYDFPVVVNQQVLFYLDLFQNGQRKTFGRWLARAGRYLPMIRAELAAAGLPQDLAYLAMIESGYVPTALSPAGAVGMWQFMAGTATTHGLTVNSHLDERRHPEKATRAALAFLRELHEAYDSWYLAVAAYNAGPGTMDRALKACGTTDFWALAETPYLKPETKLYVPKLIAAIIIARNPEAFGFADVVPEAALAFETISVPRLTGLKAVAAAGGLEDRLLAELNPELRRAVTPPNQPSYQLRVPAGSGETILASLDRVRTTVTTAYKTHVVGKDEDLADVCSRYGITRTALLKANRIRSERLRPGMSLRIPYPQYGFELASAETARRPASRPAGEPVVHRVQSGDNFSNLAKRYGVRLEDLLAWNRQVNPSRLQIGQELTVRLQAEEEPAPAKKATAKAAPAVRTASEGRKVKGRSLQAERKKGKPMQLAKAEARVTYHRVQGGDTLSSIARRYGVSPEAIKAWNHLTDDRLQPGRQLLLRLDTDLDA